jgi:UDP-N-acetylmuramate dehydrogenase
VEALRDLGVAFEQDAPLLKKTWWRAGGSADGFAVATDLRGLQDLQRAASQTNCPVFCLGNASNLLVADAGIRGLVIRLGGALAADDDLGGGLVRLGGGLKLMPLMNRMQRNGWTGLEFFAGIPGTVGGSVRMNAGTALGETVDALVDVEVVLADGRTITIATDDLHMSYRTAHLPAGGIVASARFQTTNGDPKASRAKIEAHLAHRARTQPVNVPTCGSTFRNPRGDHAGRLIEASGLKGFRIGGAEVSPKHANFLVNTGGATASDIRKLVEHVRDTVERDHDVCLIHEVHFVGDWGSDCD